jgi:hypothetical protein
MDIKINILEVASELAHKKLEEHFEFETKRIYEWVSDDESRYTEEAQDLFNEWYDYYYDFLIQLKENYE